MRNNVKEIIDQISKDPKFRNIMEKNLDRMLTTVEPCEGFSYKIDLIPETNLARLEFESSEYFCSTKYVDLDTLIFCTLHFFNMVVSNHTSVKLFLNSKEEYITHVVKGVADAIDTVYEIVMMTGGNDE